MKGTVSVNRGSIEGIKYDMLTPIKKVSGGKNSSWLCKCDCGNERIFSRANLRSGTVRHCGCRVYIKQEKHGMCNTSEYHAWHSIKARCYNPKTKGYQRYGGRGIKMCARWLESFESFYKDMGDKPTPEHSIDRFPNINGNYEPTNCRWATKKQQAIGRRATIWIVYKGKKWYQKELAHYFKITDASFSRKVAKVGIGETLKYYETKYTV